MYESAFLKIDRAERHLSEIKSIISENQPFMYIYERNIVDGGGYLYAEKNESTVRVISLVAGDIIHNLRSAFDHFWWAAASPGTDDNKLKSLRFPFMSRHSNDEFEVYADRCGLSQINGKSFRDFFLENGEKFQEYKNDSLFDLHIMDIEDKHKLLLPIADYKEISRTRLTELVPDCPAGLPERMTLAANNIDFRWSIHRVSRRERRARRLPPTTKEIIDVPMQIVFKIPSGGGLIPVIGSLEKWANESEAVIKELVHRVE